MDLLLDLVQDQGIPIAVLSALSWFFYKEHLKVKDYFLSENKELKQEIKNIKDNYDTFIKTTLIEQNEVIRQNTEVLKEVLEKLHKS